LIKEFEADLGYDMRFYVWRVQRTANRFNTDNRISVYPFSQFENRSYFFMIETKKGDFYLLIMPISVSQTPVVTMPPCKYAPYIHKLSKHYLLITYAAMHAARFQNATTLETIPLIYAVTKIARIHFTKAATNSGRTLKASGPLYCLPYSHTPYLIVLL
jgi:hypothetical protein